MDFHTWSTMKAALVLILTTVCFSFAESQSLPFVGGAFNCVASELATLLNDVGSQLRNIVRCLVRTPFGPIRCTLQEVLFTLAQLTENLRALGQCLTGQPGGGDPQGTTTARPSTGTRIRASKNGASKKN